MCMLALVCLLIHVTIVIKSVSINKTVNIIQIKCTQLTPNCTCLDRIYSYATPPNCTWAYQQDHRKIFHLLLLFMLTDKNHSLARNSHNYSLLCQHCALYCPNFADGCPYSLNWNTGLKINHKMATTMQLQTIYLLYRFTIKSLLLYSVMFGARARYISVGAYISRALYFRGGGRPPSNPARAKGQSGTACRQ